MIMPAEIIRKKRDGGQLASEEIAAFVGGMCGSDVADAQIAALAMAICLNGMSRQEAVDLTMAMRDSGEVLTWPGLDGPVVDKHSTGGVGDSVSIMLAPLLGACGAYVPMVSGRGLGHTGGTLDKMDAIPGYVSQPDTDLFQRTVRETGCAIIGQTGRLAPADKRFYAVRDLTGTVESIPLITASILSKKLAAGLQALVLDVKFGNGAFMAREHDALSLAESLVGVANGAGLKTTALITDMNQPLASAAGNAVEIRSAVDFLTGRARDPRLEEVVLALAVEMLETTGLAPNGGAAARMGAEALASGRAAETFARMVARLGGPADFMERLDAYLPQAPVQQVVPSAAAGHVGAIETRSLGLCVIGLGGGRMLADDRIDPAVGLTDLVPIGQPVAIGDPLAVVHARSARDARRAVESVLVAYEIVEEEPTLAGPVARRVAGPPQSLLPQHEP